MSGEVTIRMTEAQARLLLDVLLDAMAKDGTTNLGWRMANEIRPLHSAVNCGLAEIGK